MVRQGGPPSEILAPLDAAVAQQLLTLARAAHQQAGIEREAHIATLQMLQRLQAGELHLNQVVVTDAGWQILGTNGHSPESLDPSELGGVQWDEETGRWVDTCDENVTQDVGEALVEVVGSLTEVVGALKEVIEDDD